MQDSQVPGSLNGWDGMPAACYLRAGVAACCVSVLRKGVPWASVLVLPLAQVALVWGLGMCPLLLAGLLALHLTPPPFMNSGTPPDTSNPTGKSNIHSLASGQVGSQGDAVGGSNSRSASPKGRLDDDCDDEMLSAIEGLSSTR